VCYGNNKKDIEHIKASLAGKGLTLVNDSYVNANAPMEIKCRNGHLTNTMTYSNFKTHNVTCRECAKRTSIAEIEVYDYIKSLLPGVNVVHNDHSVLGKRELDVYIPSMGIAVEYCGLYWHSELLKKDKKVHMNKWLDCQKKGIRLVTIFEDEWVHKKEICKNRLKFILLNTDTIGARKCQVQQVTGKEAATFCREHHIQGHAASKVAFGLFYRGQLVSIMTFNKTSIAKGGDGSCWEINRFCSSIGVAGGASRLLRAFIRKELPKKIISYCDLRWGTGSVYSKMGMRLDTVTSPGYWYVKGQKRLHRFNFRRPKGGNVSEREYTASLGLYRIYDCGNYKFVWEGTNAQTK